MKAGTAAESTATEQDSANAARIAQQQKLRVNWLIAAAVSYTLDTFVLALFVVAGTIEPIVVYAYGGGAALLTAVSLAVFASGMNLRFTDPTLTTPQIILGMAMQLMVVALAPQLAFPYLANLFTVFAFGVLQLSLRQFTLVWAFGVAGMTLLVSWAGDRLGIPTATLFERTLVCFYFACILGRCLLLSVYAQRLRTRLSDSRRTAG